MRNKSLIAMFCGSVLSSLASPANSQTWWSAAGPGNLYVGIDGGWTDLMTLRNAVDVASQGPDKGQSAVSRERFSAGYNLGGHAGYQWGPWRLEGEVDYRRNDSHGLQMITPVNRPGRAAGAERHAISELANLIYDFDLGWPVTPHIGGGIGAAEVTRNLTNMFGGTHDTVTVFAYQALGGVRYQINPLLAFDIDYRYFATRPTNFISTNPDLIKSEYKSHNVVIGLSYLLGVPTQP